MKLHEFGVRYESAGAGGYCEADAARLKRIGGDAIEMTDPAGCEHERGTVKVAHNSGRMTRANANHSSIAHQKLLRRETCDNFDCRRLRDLPRERLHNGATSGVAFHAHDASMRMRRLARRREESERRAVERNAHRGQVFDAGPSFTRHAESDFFIDDPRACGDRIACVNFGRIAFLDRSGDAALSPEG